MESVDLEYDYRKLIVTNVCQPDFFVHDFICTLFRTFGLTHTGADFKQKISTTIEQKEIQRLPLPDTKKMQDNLLELGGAFFLLPNTLFNVLHALNSEQLIAYNSPFQVTDIRSKELLAGWEAMCQYGIDWKFLYQEMDKGLASVRYGYLSETPHPPM